jgi:hypothetical protein
MLKRQEGRGMSRKRVAIAMMALWLLVQMGIASGARAEEPHLGADIAAGAISALATAVAFPVRVAACAATVALGGVTYGLTMGTSELLRQEIVAGTNYTCGGRLYITPEEVKQFAKEPEQRR